MRLSLAPSITAAGKRSAQIADQSARNGIWNHPSSDNATLLLMVDPSYEPEITIDDFDIDAGGECIRSYERLTKGLASFFGLFHDRLRQSSHCFSPSVGTVQSALTGAATRQPTKYSFKRSLTPNKRKSSVSIQMRRPSPQMAVIGKLPHSQHVGATAPADALEGRIAAFQSPIPHLTAVPSRRSDSPVATTSPRSGTPIIGAL